MQGQVLIKMSRIAVAIACLLVYQSVTASAIPVGLSLAKDYKSISQSLRPPPFDAKYLQADPNCPYHPSTVPLPSGSLPTTIQNALKNLEGVMNSSINPTSVPGIAASVSYKDKTIWSKGFGVKSKTGGSAAPDTDTIFRIGSVSKVFATLTMYQLFERGMVKSLDDPLSDYCQGFSIHNPYSSSGITLRQMAAQMSGLPREAPCKEASDTKPSATNICDVTTEEVINRLKDQSLIFPPWTVPSYSNLAFALLGRCLVEKFYPGKMTYEQYVQKNILDPLQMTNTGFNITDSVQAKMAVGYEPDGSIAPLYDLGWLGPAGQMYSTTSDLTKFAQFFYSVTGENVNKMADSVLSADNRRLMQLQVFVNRDRLTGFGTPWEIRFEGNYTILRKGGNVDGYSALFSFIPDLQLGLFILFSGSIDEFGASNSAYQLLIPAFEAALKPLQKPYPYPPDPKVYEGEFTIPGGVATVNITTYKNQLVAQSGLGGSYLSYDSPLLFQIAFSDSVQPCLSEELLASRHEYVEFAPKDSSGLSPSFTIPGLYPGLLFSRIK